MPSWTGTGEPRRVARSSKWTSPVAAVGVTIAVNVTGLPWTTWDVGVLSEVVVVAADIRSLWLPLNALRPSLLISIGRVSGKSATGRPTRRLITPAARTSVNPSPEAQRVVKLACGLEGLVRNVGVHACAVILSSEPLLDTLPLWQRDDGAVITGWDMDECDSLGLLKMDFLGLRTLTILDDALRGIAASGGPEIDHFYVASCSTKAIYSLRSCLGVR